MAQSRRFILLFWKGSSFALSPDSESSKGAPDLGVPFDDYTLSIFFASFNASNTQLHFFHSESGGNASEGPFKKRRCVFGSEPKIHFPFFERIFIRIVSRFGIIKGCSRSLGHPLMIVTFCIYFSLF